ncbi:KIN14B-interacting protein At4g14310-like [Zingiber officinale]|uniref:At4g14310 8-bladed propeller domain-containing protein n=1 Tax=Zingiber officinale TaxID=94328 RepID=A0A8J5G7T1_ZINOF|nr:KIN14B-interacting protein At4g14310-like [Zingiber officinale]KAG6502425.1 hypothetical protein ZIOFF_034698 [Zingiber officinale]
MSTRLKERGGGGNKIMACKPNNKGPLNSTLNDKRPVSAPRRSTVAVGKENPRDVSVGRASSSRRKVEEKPAPPFAAVRFSTSSLPRGKSCKPSDLVSDIRGDRRPPRVSTSDQLGRAPGRDLEAEAGGRKSFGVSGALLPGKGLYDQALMRNAERLATATGGVSYLRNPKPKGDTKSLDLIAEKLGRKSDGDLNAKGSSNSSKQKNEPPFLEKKVTNLKENASLQNSKNKTFLVSSSKAIDGETPRFFPSGLKDTSYAVSNPKPQGQTDEIVAHATTSNTKKEDCLEVQLEPSKDVGYDVKIKDIPCEEERVDSVPKVEVAHGRSANIRVFEKSNDDVKGARVVSKYPSKLHEKLAMLEGKVQKIASEIKRTKEILDGNNPDDSKLILSDIQSQICGIEKAVAHAVRGTTTSQQDSSKVIKANCEDQNNCVPDHTDQTIIPSYTVRELKNDVIEARFFPHHKFLKDRNSSGILGGHGSDRSDSDLEDGSSCSVGENPIAMKFLASLDLEQGEPSKHVNLASEHMTVQARIISAAEYASKKMVSDYSMGGIELVADENFEKIDNLEKKSALMLHEQPKGPYKDQLCEIGQKPSTGGWFVSEGEAVLLSHHDGSCSYYDMTNYEFKAEYNPPSAMSNNLWGDCWLIRAPGTDGCSGKYVVAASAGNASESGFCSWDYYTREVKAFCIGDSTDNSPSPWPSRIPLGSLSNASLRTSQQQWWYKPCGPLLISTATRQKSVNAYDIRDGELVMKWETSSPVIGMDYSSPLQWRSRGKVIVAGTEAISLWDVNSLNPQPLLSVAFSGKRIYSLHVNNTDAEHSGGIQQRVSSSEVEGNDGVFCTQESINVLDFRVPSGIGIKVSKHGGTGHSIFSRGDYIFVGSTEGRLPIKACPRSRIQHYSLRKGKLVASYQLPEFNSHAHHSSLTQVWGNGNTVMGICGLGLFVFDAFRDENSQTFCFDRGNTIDVKETIGPDDLYCPTFDYSGSRVLVISRDRPASWRYVL